MACYEPSLIFAPMGSGKTRFVKYLDNIRHPLADKFLDGDEILKEAGVPNQNRFWYPELNPEIDFSEQRMKIVKVLLDKYRQGYSILYSPSLSLFHECLDKIASQTHMDPVSIIVVNACDDLTRWGNLRFREGNGEYCPPLHHFEAEKREYRSLRVESRLRTCIRVLDKFKKLLPVKIAISGKSRAGKDTVGSYLKDTKSFSILKFADPLYELMRHAQIVCDFEKEKDRQFLQYIGTEWARAKNPDVWVNLTLKQIRVRKTLPIVITDLRFENEFDALKKEGFWLVRIKRDAASTDETFGNGDRSHSSETGLDGKSDSDFDVVIENNGTIEDLHEKIDDLFVSRFNI